MNQLEAQIRNLAGDMTDVKGKLVEVKEDLSENRQYTTSKYHEIRVDVTDNLEAGNAKQRELRQIYDELKQTVDKFVRRGGTTYTRWGRTVCPETGPELIYSGYAGGSSHSHMGGAASMLCLPMVPEWGAYSDKLDPVTGYIYGAEYQDGQDRTDKLFGHSHHDQDVPCAVCNLNSRSSVIMIPGKKSCFQGWTVEYTGYLMTGRHNHESHKSATDYYCIDGSPEDIHGGKANHNGYLLYFVESRCGSLRCPPYVEGRELTCVVCTK